MSTIDARIQEQGDLIRKLKLEAADKALISEEVAKLNALKAEKGPAENTTQSKGKKAKTVFQLKVPKGTKDHLPHEMLLRNQIFKTITAVFERHGAVTIDTPVFELKEILSGKYGEDSKLIYDLQDQGGELCSLRYDLTCILKVPFARFLAMHGNQYQSIKRYHIAKVYRRDNPAMTKGRMREFYQCDFDIAGQYDSMVPDAEVLKIVTEVLDALEVGAYTIKVNHRKLLDGIFAICGVPEDKIRTISSAVDKLDKLPWLEVKKEMTEEKGLAEEVADRIGEYVKLSGGAELLEKLKQDATLLGNTSAKDGLQDMETLFKYLKIFKVLPKISFDLSLARGLDYYTGIIYECVVEGSAPPGFLSPEAAPAAAPTPAPAKKSKSKAKAGEEEEIDESQVGVGSIAAGGRYDNLVGMFSPQGPNRGRIPCVGISFGVERIFSILQKKRAEQSEANKTKMKEVDAFVLSLGDGMLEERLTIADELWSAGLKVEYTYKVKPKAGAQWDAIDRDSIPLVVIVAPDEWKEGKVRVKEQLGKESSEGRGEIVERANLVAYLKERLA